MTGEVPLAVRVGGQYVTHEIADVQFQKNAVGGAQSITLRLIRPLNLFDPQLAALSEVRIYDARSAEIVADGRLSDTGRSAGDDGQTWDIVAFGPAQHASDQTLPYIVVTSDLTPFRRGADSTKNADVGTDERGDTTPSIMIRAEQGKTVATTWAGESRFRLVKESGMDLARINCSIDAGVTDANYIHQIQTRVGAGTPALRASASSSTSTGTLDATIVTDFPAGEDVFSFQVVRNTSATTGAEAHWFEFWNLTVRTQLKAAGGGNRTTGYGLTASADEVVDDLLGRFLDQYDGAGATVSTGGTYAIDQMSYPDGVTAEQVLEDLMLLEPAFRWYAGPDVTGSGYAFTWAPWPTTVRYEVTLEDGGDFPVSAQELFNQVNVRWRTPDGRVRSTTRTLACSILDARSITRTALLDLGDEIGSSAAADRAGDNFLADHNVPKNAGTLTVSRPIYDRTAKRMVDPHEIEPGELIRVRGVESYADSLNADSNDGLTVFRIWSMTYSSAGNTAQLELDTHSRTEANALTRLFKQRNRRR